jgi:hypothetical protein
MRSKRLEKQIQDMENESEGKKMEVCCALLYLIRYVDALIIQCRSISCKRRCSRFSSDDNVSKESDTITNDVSTRVYYIPAYVSDDYYKHHQP